MQNNKITAVCASCRAPLQLENLTGQVLTCAYCGRQHILTSDLACKQTCEFYWKPASSIEEVTAYSLWKMSSASKKGKKAKSQQAVSVELVYVPVVDIRDAKPEAIFHDYDHIKSEVEGLLDTTSWVSPENRIGTHELKRDYPTARIVPIDGNILKGLSEQYGKRVSPVVKYIPFYVVRLGGNTLVLNASMRYANQNDEQKRSKNGANTLFRVISWIYLIAAIIASVIVYREYGHEHLNVYLYGVLWIVASIIGYVALLFVMTFITWPIDMIIKLFK